MGLAPEPGAHSAAEASDAARRAVMTVTMGGKSLKLYPASLGPADDAASRAETGVPISPMFAGGYVLGMDSLLTLWWMARRKNGEPGLRYADVLAEYPDFASVAAAAPAATVGDDDEVGLDPEA